MRLPFLAICLVAVAALTVAGALSLASPRGAHVANADACSEPTPPPGPTPVPHTVSYCHGDAPGSDGLRGAFQASAQRLDVSVSRQPDACGDANVTSGLTAGPDFTFEVTVTFPAACIGPGGLVELSFACSQEPSGTAEPCLPSSGCFGWTLGGQTQGYPCPTPNCGGVPCCNGLPCPTATPAPTTSCPEPTPTPSPSLQYYPSFCNDTGESVDALEFFETSGYQSVDVEVSHNPPGCPDATISSTGNLGLDFSIGFAITWPSPCVDPSESVQLSFSCGNPGGTPAPCELGATCAGWTLVGKPVGQPCEPPACGNVPCCSGLPCPTPRPPTPDTDHDGIPDAYDNCPTVPNPAQRNRGSDGFGDLCNTPPGDLNCDFLVRPSDLLTLLYDLGGVPQDTSQLCTEIAAGRTRPLADLNCDGTVSALDLVRLLRYEGGLPVDEIASCPAIGG